MVNDRKFSQKIMSTFSIFEKSAKYNFQLVVWRATVSSWNVSIKKGVHLKVVMLNFGYDNHDEQIRRSGRGWFPTCRHTTFNILFVIH